MNMDTAHIQTDRLLQQVEREIISTYRIGWQAALDELNIANLYREVESETRKAVKTEIDVIVGFLIVHAIIAAEKSIAKVQRMSDRVYKLNYSGMAKSLNIPQSTDDGAEETKYQKRAFDRLTNELEKVFQPEIYKFVRQGLSPDELEQRIKTLFMRNGNSLVRISRTEATRLENRARLDAMLEAQKRGEKIKKQWRAIIDRVTRDSHKLINLEIQPLESLFSNGLLFPGDANGPPEQIVNCRCWIVSVR